MKSDAAGRGASAYHHRHHSILNSIKSNRVGSIRIRFEMQGNQIKANNFDRIDWYQVESSSIKFNVNSLNGTKLIR